MRLRRRLGGLSAATTRPVETSQRLITLSLCPEAINVPSGEYATALAAAT